MGRKLIFIICTVMLAALILTGCSQPTYELKIKTDVTKYSPLMSSVFGIGMTPEGITGQKDTNLQDMNLTYRWKASSGWFYLLQDKKEKEVVNTGEKVTWVAELPENSKETADIIITLEALDAETGKVLAETKLTIEQEGVFYTVKSK